MRRVACDETSDSRHFISIPSYLLRSERRETWRQTHILLEFLGISQIKAPRTMFELSIMEVYSSIQDAETQVSRDCK